jgi:hypothetical protein
VKSYYRSAWLTKPQADPIIPSPNSRTYVKGVLEHDAKAHDYYRHFEAPGVGHCYTVSGLFPQGIFRSLVDWVEKGTAPDVQVVDRSGFSSIKKSRILCPYPQRSIYKGSGDTEQKESYYCAEHPK